MKSKIKPIIFVLSILISYLGHIDTVYAATELYAEGVWITDDRYHGGEFCENSNYDLRCVNNGTIIGTTFDFFDNDVESSLGYSTILSVNGSEKFIQNKGSAVWHEGVSINTSFTRVENGALQVTYTIYNGNSSARTIGIVTSADLMLNFDDNANCDLLYCSDGSVRGFTLNSDGYYLHYVTKQSKYVTDLDTLWLANWLDDVAGRYNNRWNSNEISLGNVDSCFSMSWKNRTIEAYETQKYSYLVGMVKGWSYNILYNGNGGSMENGSTQNWVQYAGDTVYNYAENPFNRDGYDFVAWGEADTATTGVTSVDTFINIASSNGYKQLYAIWKPSTYKQIVQVRYENADGTFTAYSDVINANYQVGSTVSWSRPADETYQAASITSYAVTEAKTTQVTVYRKQFSVGLTKGTGISAVSGADSYRVGQSVTIDATVSTGYTWKDWTGTFTETTKNYTFAMPSSNVTLTANAHDITAPTVTLSQSPTAWTNGNVTITATASDNGSGLHATPYSWDNGSTWTATKTKTVSVNGTYSVKVRDKAGNIASASITVTNIDKLLPSLSLSAKANGASIATNIWTKYDVIVTEIHSDQAATSSYGQSNFNTNYIKWANPTYGSYENKSSVTVSTSAGTVLERNVQATVQDKAGNTASASFYVKIDKQAPTVTLTQNPTAWTNGDVTLSVTANDGAGIGLNSKPYKWFSDTAFNTTTQVTVTKNGTYSIQVQDKLGNTATASIEVTNIDKLSPNITGLEAFATISEIDRNEGKQTVTVTLTDPSNTDYGASGIKGGTLTVTNSDNNLSKTWNISDTGIIEIDITDDTTKELSELFYGNFRVTVNAEDNVGNTSTKYIDTTEFTLDTELIHADSYKSSLFVKGESGLFIFYAGGYPDEVRVYFPADAGLDQEYSQIFYYTKQKAIESGMIYFYVPFEAIEGDYTIYVESYKNGKLLQTKSQAFQITEESILDRLQTQLSR